MVDTPSAPRYSRHTNSDDNQSNSQNSIAFDVTSSNKKSGCTNETYDTIIA